MAVMSIVATSMMAVAIRSFTTTSTITNRRDVLTDGRIAIDQMTKQLRQGESVDLSREQRIDAQVRDVHRRRAGHDRVAGDRLAPVHARAVPRRWRALRAAGLADHVQDREDAGCSADPFTYSPACRRRRPGHDRPHVRDEHVDRRPDLRRPTAQRGELRSHEERTAARDAPRGGLLPRHLDAADVDHDGAARGLARRWIASLRQSSLSLEWSKALTVAEGGRDAAVTSLGESRAATNAVRSGRTTSATASAASTRCGGPRRGTDRRDVGRLLPDEGRPQFAREVQDHLRAGPVVQVRDLLPDGAVGRATT